MKRLIAAICAFCVASLALADDPPRKASGRTRRRADDEPPPCAHMAKAKGVGRGVTSARRPPPQSMPEMFDRMMGDMARNPSNGFAGVMKEHEAAATASTPLTQAEERRMGRQQRDGYLREARRRGYGVVEEGRDTRYVKALVDRLARRMKNRARYPEIEVTLIDAPIPDGQSFPGGFLVFTRGLLDEPDEATVAAVVAHELAHLDRGHLNEYARRDKMAANAFQFGPDMMANPAAMMTRGLALGAVMMDPFRPEHEHEADCQATTWLYQEGYDPRGLAEYFTRVNARLRDQPDNPFWKMGRSHPYSLDRRAAVLERLAQLRRWKSRDDLKRYVSNLKDRTPKGE